MYWLIIIAFCMLTAFLVWASADVGSNIYLKTLCRAKTTERVVALTFDDGPNEVTTPRVLDVLKRYGVQATFFVVGQSAEQYPEIVQRIVSEGHTVANHTYSHKALFPLSSAQSVKEELQRCNDAIASITGQSVNLFRPPFGVTNPIIARVVKAMGLQAIGWSIRSLDTLSGRSREQICRRICNRLHPGAVILLHDRCKDAEILLEMLMTQLSQRGYKVVSVSELLNIRRYED